MFCVGPQKGHTGATSDREFSFAVKIKTYQAGRRLHIYSGQAEVRR